tara:strand:+ start:191 stop:1840 length:1650 start_codon:yes stop_codon:yes gene_type:complete
MSLNPEAKGRTIPEETVRVARASFPKGNPYMTLRDELGLLYTDRHFAPLFAPQGPSAQSPGQLALVTILQFAEGLSDRQAAEAVRGRIDWKYLLGLELTNAGFDYSLLCDFRSRLVEGGVEGEILDLLLHRFKQVGVLKARGRQRTDSTHVLAAIRVLNRLEFVGETLRSTLNALSSLVPQWVQSQVPKDWYERYGPRFQQYRLPKSQTQRAALAVTIGRDGHQVLALAYAPDAPTLVRTHPSIEVLRQVWVQQYSLSEKGVNFRDKDNLPPGEKLIVSPYDPEARMSVKRQTDWVGYKVHLTETCGTDHPHLITHVETTQATLPDSQTTQDIHQRLDQKALLPSKHFVDKGYIDAENLVRVQKDYGTDLIGPAPEDTSWQARKNQGFDASSFEVDWKNRQGICPLGNPSRTFSQSHSIYDKPVIHIHFHKADCQACSSREKCTKGKGPRTLHLLPQDLYEALKGRRHEQHTSAFQKLYAIRAGVEGTISQATRAFQMRRSRYIGLAKTHLGHIVTAAAINLARYVAWVEQIPLAKTRVGPFAALAPAA